MVAAHIRSQARSAGSESRGSPRHRFPAIEAQFAFHEGGHAVATVYYRRQLRGITLPFVPGRWYVAHTKVTPSFRMFRKLPNADAFLINTRAIQHAVLIGLAGDAAEHGSLASTKSRPFNMTVMT